MEYHGFIGTSNITLFDGTTKELKDIVIGDKVKSYPDSVSEVVNIIKSTCDNVVKFVFDDCELVGCRDTLFYVGNEWKVIEIGELGLQEIIELGEQELYELDVEEVDNYYVNGKLVHNADKMIYIKSNDGSRIIAQEESEFRVVYLNNENYPSGIYHDSGISYVLALDCTDYLGLSDTPNASSPNIVNNTELASYSSTADVIVYAVVPRTQTTLDLSTLNLPEGTHSIQMSVSGSGKRDSELSEAVEYTVSASGETWVINATPLLKPSVEVNINFTSNDMSFTMFWVDARSSLVYSNVSPIVVFDLFEGWSDQNYRTVIFETAPTGDLLTWLQSNAVKQ